MVSTPVFVSEKIRFGEFELNPSIGELRRLGVSLKLERIPMGLLLLLIEQRDKIVTREEIVARIWGCQAFFDTDNSINGAVRKIRQVLGENPERPQFIQTISGRGYRFIGEVSFVDAQPVTAPSVAQDVQVRAPRRHASAIKFFAAALVTALLGLSIAASISRWKSPATSSSARSMLAVLPFDNLTGDASQEYFSDGLTDELISQLGRVDPQHLGLIGLTSVMHYKKAGEPLPQIGRELQVQYVLEGSVRRNSERVRIDVRLIQVKDQTDLWSRQYDRELTNLLTLQEEIAQEVASEIEPTLTHSRPALAGAPSLSPDAYQAYDLDLKGRYLWNKRTPDGFLQAISYFNQALAQNPNDARAYAGLADSYSMMSGYQLTPPQKVMPRALEAAHKALQIDDSLAEAHASLALIAQNYNWDWPTAEKEYRRAIQLDPNYPTAHHWYAEFLAFQGRFEEALIESERAKQLDPLSLIIASDNAAIFYFSRQYDQAIQRFRTVLDTDPAFTRSHLIVAAYVQKRQFKEAIAEMQEWRRIDKESPEMFAWEAYVYGCAGDPARAHRALQLLSQASQTSDGEPTSMLALAYLGLNDKDDALKWMEKSYRDHTNAPTGWKVDPIYDPVRNDPRFQQLLHRVGPTE